jgi:hypothetical protein
VKASGPPSPKVRPGLIRSPSMTRIQPPHQDQDPPLLGAPQATNPPAGSVGLEFASRYPPSRRPWETFEKFGPGGWPGPHNHGLQSSHETNDPWYLKARITYRKAALRLFTCQYGRDSPEAALAHFYLDDVHTAHNILRLVLLQLDDVLVPEGSARPAYGFDPRGLFQDVARRFSEFAAQDGSIEQAGWKLRAERFATVVAGFCPAPRIW